MPSPEQGFVTAVPEVAPAAREPAGVAAGHPHWQRWVTATAGQLAGIAFREAAVRIVHFAKFVLLYWLVLLPERLFLTPDARSQ